MRRPDREARGPVGVVTLAALLLTSLLAPAPALADDGPTTDLHGRSTATRHVVDPDELWIDPAITFGIPEAQLEPAPDFDVTTLHDSAVFAAGVDWIEVRDDPLPEYAGRHVRVLQVLATRERQVMETGRQITALRPEIIRLNGEIEHELSEEARLATEIGTYRAAIAEFAVRAFIGEEETELTALTDASTGVGENQVLADEVRVSQFSEIDRREAEIARRQARRSRLEGDRQAVRGRVRTLQAERLGLLDDVRTLSELTERTATDYRVVLHDRLEMMVGWTDVPLVAINAYVIAARTMAVERPRCDIEWWMLAGIGHIESQHGHFGDSTLDVNGQSTSAITGPALDGRILDGADFLTASARPAEPATLPEAPAAAPGGSDAANAGAAADAAEPPPVKRLAMIRDTDDGFFDGDARYDRAVGPMQFIPQTWRTYQTDGNRDGENDPQNVYDASLASARYLCTAAGSMASEDGQRRAYFAYNHDEAYSEAVLAAADRYRRQIRIPGDPTGAAPRLGVGELPDDAVSRAVTAAWETLDTSELPDW